jgi:CPA1 family monovalent cation:H+ antiporter
VTEIDFNSLGLLLIVAALVAMISRRIGLPYTAGLVLAGVALAFAPIGEALPLSRDLIYTVFLPPLIFEAALQLEWRSFREQLPLTAVLACLGVVLAGALTAAGMHGLLGWSWLGAGFFGVLIAATDPVAVIAAFKEMRAEPRLSMVVESESLLNDGVAAVGFAVLMGIAGGAAPSVAGIAGTLLWTALGGIALGAAVAFVVLFVAGRTEDHLVEVTLTTVIAWGAFLLAEHVHASGVFAALAAGLIVGNRGLSTVISKTGKRHVVDFWEYAAFLANSCLFLLIGSHEARQPFLPLLGTVATAIALTLVARAASVYPLAALFRGTSLRLPTTYQHVLVWGGLRGAIGLALALSVPESVPERGLVIAVTFGVVAFSVFVQGLTMPPLLRRWKLTEASQLSG